jgi:hypothetical protein
LGWPIRRWRVTLALAPAGGEGSVSAALQLIDGIGVTVSPARAARCWASA